MAPRTTGKMPWAPPRRHNLQARSTRGGTVSGLFETFVVTTLFPGFCFDFGNPVGTGCFVDTISCPTYPPCATIPTITGS